MLNSNRNKKRSLKGEIRKLKKKNLKTKITDIIQPTLKAYRVNFTFYLPFLQMEKHPYLNILEDLLELVLPEFYILAEQTMHSL